MPARIASGAALVLALSLGGCLGGGERDDVESYLERANEVQNSAEGVNRAVSIYRRLAEGEVRLDRARPRLAQAEETIAAITGDLEQLEPPSEARALHEQLLEVFRLNSALAAETGRLVRFLPAARRALKPLEGINRRMNRGLQSSSASDQATALRRFAAELGPVLDRLKALEPPLILGRAHDQRIKQLRSVRSLAGRLRDALRRDDAEAVAALLIRFSRAAGSRPSAGLDRRSVRRYKRLYRELVRATRDLRREESKLRQAILDL